MRDQRVLQKSPSEALAIDAKSRGHTVFTGGFPCQNISPAGRGGGLEGSESRLWHDFFRIIAATRPGWVVIENHERLRTQGLETMLGQLTSIGYDSEWHCISAGAIGAEHTRERLWVISYAHEIYGKARMGLRPADTGAVLEVRDRARQGLWLESSRPAPGVADGLSDQLDKRARIEGVGNAIVPEIAELIAGRIRECIMNLDSIPYSQDEKMKDDKK